MLTEGMARTYSPEEAFSYCSRLATTHYENFTVVSWLLPKPLRPYMHAMYAFCRLTDDLGDESEGNRLAQLDEWETDLRRCYDGSPRHPVMVALQQTVGRFNVPVHPFLRLIEANRMDQRQGRYSTYAELLHYCEHSANPVGHMVLYLFGYRDEERQRLSDATCTGLQLANFWQDVWRDWKIGRIYIPLEDMERFGYSESQLSRREHNSNFRELMAFQVARARDLFAKGCQLASLVDRRLRLDIKLFNLGGLAVLDAIENGDYNVLNHRPILSRAKKLSLVLRGLMPVAVPVRGS